MATEVQTAPFLIALTSLVAPGSDGIFVQTTPEAQFTRALLAATVPDKAVLINNVLFNSGVYPILENIIPGGIGDTFPDNTRAVPRILTAVTAPFVPPIIIVGFPALFLAP